MNTHDNIFLNKEATDKLIAGISKTVDAIRGTYGAAGGNVILEESLYPFHSVRNDGKAIVDKILLADPIENIGANIIKEVGNNAEKDSGDGRKTTMLLTEAILKEAQQSSGLPLEIKRSLDECIPLINKAIDEQKKDITVDDIKAVATIASESEVIGQQLQEIYQKIGKDGIVEVDNSNLPETFHEITEGVRLRGARAFGQYSNTEPGKAVYTKPLILISKDKIMAVSQLEDIMKAMSKAGFNELVIYCEDIDMSVASRLAYTHLTGGFKTLIIKSPILWKNWLFEDFARMTGATMVDAKEGKTFANLTLQDLGICDKIVSDDEETRVIGIKDLTEYIQQLNDEGATNDQMKLRASWLSTKVAILKVGANSESELSYISKKAKDACHASFLALQGGVVMGGGVSLMKTLDKLPMDTLGGAILRQVLQTPFKQIIKNMGIPEVSNVSIPEIGFGENVIDPALVIKNAVKNSIGVASTIITARGIIVLPKDSKQNGNSLPAM